MEISKLQSIDYRNVSTNPIRNWRESEVSLGYP